MNPYKRTFASVTVEDSELRVTCEGEPLLYGELIGHLKARESYGTLYLDAKHKDEVIDICRDYCSKVFLVSDDGNEKFLGKTA